MSRIVGQRLARRICPHCQESYRPNLSDLELLGIPKKKINSYKWKRGKGCNKCFNSGYLGREAIVEMIDIDKQIREIIYDGTMTQLHRYLEEINFQSFRQAAIAKVIAGMTTVEEVLRVLPRTAFYESSLGSNNSHSSKQLSAN
ncbi:MAG: hypothetical protein ACOC0N_00290 [Chroococcales cyanobacterium]